MKKIFISLILIACFTKVFALTNDVIPIFLEYYEDGKKTDTIIYLEINVFKSQNILKWTMNEVIFSQHKDSSNVAILTSQSRSDDGAPSINVVKWEKGTMLEFKYDSHLNKGDGAVVKAVKNTKSKYEWEVYGIGTFKRDNKIVKYEFKGVKKVNLKYSNLVLTNLYMK